MNKMGRYSYSCKLFSFSAYNGLFWFRFGIKGPGVMIKDIKRHSLLFSQCNGLRKSILIYSLYVVLLEKSII